MEGASSSSFFANRACEYYPCHELKDEGFNCLFCFCPMYHALCPGNPRYSDAGGALAKDCSGCDYPHRRENYKAVIGYLRSQQGGGADG